MPGRPPIFPMPPAPLSLLRQLHELLKARGGGAAGGGKAERVGVRARRARVGEQGLSRPVQCPTRPLPGALTTTPPKTNKQTNKQTHHRWGQVLVDQLRQKCLEEARSEEPPRGYSALTQDPKKEWAEEVGRGGGAPAWPLKY